MVPQSHDLYLEVLGALLHDAQVFDKVIIAGDFNVEFKRNASPVKDLHLCAIDLLPFLLIRGMMV